MRSSLKRDLRKVYDLLLNAFGPQNWWPAEDPFEVMVGAILTQNTNWGNVEKAISNLRDHGSLDQASVSSMTESKLASLIRPSGYYNLKARRLKGLVGFLTTEYSGEISCLKEVPLEDIRRQLLSIKGIGPETADSIILYALERPVFVVDSYTKRIISRLRLAEKNMGYDGLQRIFHENIPEDTGIYNEYHALLVRLGKEYCRPRPLCGGCPVHELCGSA
ncbi:MAG: endonuclease III domain-containing protein [Nitrospirota bacterium]|nr:MAG: endonuclease III domain-containing protein [Nitrospirota bacterium]